MGEKRRAEGEGRWEWKKWEDGKKDRKKGKKKEVERCCYFSGEAVPLVLGLPQ